MDFWGREKVRQTADNNFLAGLKSWQHTVTGDLEAHEYYGYHELQGYHGYQSEKRVSPE